MENFFTEAMAEAEKAEALGEIPVGCVIVKEGTIVGRGHNRKETGRKAFLHAEFCAVDMAAERLSSWRLQGCTVHVTLEPCPMCMSLLTQSRVERIVIYSPSTISGACGTVIDLTCDPQSGYTPEIVWDIREEAQDIMEDFFRRMRQEREAHR